MYADQVRAESPLYPEPKMPDPEASNQRQLPFGIDGSGVVCHPLL